MADEERREDLADSESADRREFLKNVSNVAMAAGLIGGYGSFGLIAGRYLYPATVGEVMWQFVAEVAGIKVGEAIRYRGPAGEAINIARQSRNGDADDFIALSSTCPHLGCQVRWEGQNNRFFCPCHSGVFDPSGKAIAGPPGEAGQSLPRYDLKVENGMLHIAVPPPRFSDANETGGGGGAVIESENCISAPGHDPCLAGRSRKKNSGTNA
jgi:nitrite reductase/ring-hydroxylating ferredoxin subunit